MWLLGHGIKCWQLGKSNLKRELITGIVFHNSLVLCNLHILIQLSTSSAGSSPFQIFPWLASPQGQPWTNNYKETSGRTKSTPLFTLRIPRGNRIHSKGIHCCWKVVAVSAVLILVKCGLRDSGSAHPTWTFRRGFLCEHIHILEAGWEVTYCELLWLKCWVTPSWGRTSTGWLSPSNISLPLFKHWSPTLPTSP